VSQLVGWLSSNTAVLSILGAAVAFVWSTSQQVSQRKAEAREREFQAFHRLVKELVSPDTADGVMRLDRQCAVVFELRHFPRYYQFTERMLAGLRKVWANDSSSQRLRLIEEIDLTLAHIQRNK
jgi:hypothetical protein